MNPPQKGIEVVQVVQGLVIRRATTASVLGSLPEGSAGALLDSSLEHYAVSRLPRVGH
jgi:hypothetical protein